jgi:hypothetical protein
MAPKVELPYKTVGEMLLHADDMTQPQREACADFCERQGDIMNSQRPGFRDDKSTKVFIAACAKLRGEDPGEALIKAFPVRFGPDQLPLRDPAGNVINEPNALKAEAAACLRFVTQQAGDTADTRTMKRRKADVLAQIEAERQQLAGSVAAQVVGAGKGK